MDIKLKSKYNKGILAMVVVLCICAAGMLSTYKLLAQDVEESASKEYLVQESRYEIMEDLCKGNYILYNEFSNETDRADILEYYQEDGENAFELLRKYMDCGVFDENGKSLVGNISEAKAERLKEENTDYAFRVAFTYQSDGELSDIRVSGDGMSEETQYYLERKGLSDMEGAESSYWSDISTPSDVTVVYGMTEENQESYINNSGWTAYMSSVYAMLGNSRMTVFVMSFAILAGAAAVLLPLKKKWDMGDAPIFGVPFEIVIFVLCMIPAFFYFPAAVVNATINGEFPQVVPGSNSILNQVFSGFVNFAMWFIIYGIVYWGFTCLRAVFTMKKEYFKKRTLIARLIHWTKQEGDNAGKKILNGLRGIFQCIRKFLGRQYDALVHLNFQDKTNRTILKIIGINFVVLAVICSFWFFGIFALIVYSILLFFFLRKYFNDLQGKYKMLLKSTNELADGKLDTPIEGDAGIFNPIQEELKKIQTGFKKAVEKEVKSERMKTELVTNVSHDLKTPLTAIITYTDLLKNERDEEKRREYIDVLERKSLRLKVLIEDLFEISKAASNNVVMHFMKVDIVDLLKQAGLEQDDKIKKANLEFRWKLPDHKIILWLDSQKTYRIFENLIINITKYAMPHTRVYIEVAEEETQVHIFMKNISATELDFNVEEITDRFVRGDSSRNTEGSGLGLAIAKSFAQLQHGELKIATEADLFKAEIVFPKKVGEEIAGESKNK